MAIVVELARQQWEDGHRRLEADSRDPDLRQRLLEQVEVLTDELRRRVGRHFSLADLVGAYDGAEHWARDVIAERCPRPGWARYTATAADAAFHLYARGAQDYRP